MHHAARRRAARSTLSLLCAGLLLAAAAPANAATPGPLRAGGSTFWEGPTIASGNVLDPSLCDSSCRTYPLVLKTGGARLRVALDTPMRSDSFGFQVIDPSGSVAASATTDNAFDAEAFVRKPAAGTWSIRVMPKGV